MSKSTFSFASLQQERDTFELPDGTEIEFQNRVDFSAGESARALGLSNRVQGIIKRLENEPKNAVLADSLEKANRELLQMILPDMPEDIANGLNMGKLGYIVRWWSEKQDERENGHRQGEG